MSGTGSSTILPAVEQRIGSKSQPLDAAAVNPAYIPGLTSPVPAEPKDAAEETGEAAAEETPSTTASAPETSGDPVSDAAPADAAPEDPGSVPESASEAEVEAGSEETDAEEAGAEPDGPVFEASDRRASIRADHTGVRLRLDDQEAEFRWDEIGAVETESPRFGKRFTVTVHTPDSRWYPIEIEASARSRFQEWDEQLDAVLDAFFEDDAETEADAEAEPESSEEELTDSEPEAVEADAVETAERPARGTEKD